MAVHFGHESNPELSTEWWVRVLMESTKQIDGIALMKLISKLLERNVIHQQTFKTLLFKMQSRGKSLFLIYTFFNLYFF